MTKDIFLLLHACDSCTHEAAYSKLNYENHVQSVFRTVNKTIGLLRKFQPTLPRNSLVTICKTFIRSHLDCGDVIYD